MGGQGGECCLINRVLEEGERREEEEFWRGSALHRASSRPLEREDYGEDWRRGEGQRRRVNEQVVKVFRGRLGERGGHGCFIGRVRQKAREGERARRLSGDQSIGRFSPCFFVNSSAFFKNFLRSFEYSSARSALRGCSGWGSFTSAMSD